MHSSCLQSGNWVLFEGLSEHSINLFPALIFPQNQASKSDASINSHKPVFWSHTIMPNITTSKTLFTDRFLCPNPLIFNRLPHLRNKKKEEKHLNTMNSKQRNERYLKKWRITDKVPPSASEKWNDLYVYINSLMWSVNFLYVFLGKVMMHINNTGSNKISPCSDILTQMIYKYPFYQFVLKPFILNIQINNFSNWPLAENGLSTEIPLAFSIIISSTHRIIITIKMFYCI